MDSKIKILYTIPNFKTAGSQYVLLSLFRKINKDLFDPYICIEKFPETVPADISEKRSLVFKWTANKFQDTINFKKFLKNHKIDIVHSWDYKSNYLEALACRMAGVKYLYTKKNNAWSKRWQLKSLLATYIAYDNPEMGKRFFHNYLFQHKITFVPHGVDIKFFKPLPPLERRTFNIGCIGNIGTNKNQLFILKALSDLPENIALHLYGNEEYEYRISLNKYINKYGLTNRVHFHGYVENKDIPEIFRNIDLLVLASFQEGLPVSILEAMACGVPVLSSDSGGGAKSLLDSEFLFTLKDSNEFITQTLKFYNMEEGDISKLMEEGIEKIHKSYTIEKEVLTYESLYKKILLN